MSSNEAAERIRQLAPIEIVERSRRYETGRADESDTADVRATDRTMLLMQIDRMQADLDAALAALPPDASPGLDVNLIQRAMFRLVGTSHVPDLDSGGIAFLAHRKFAELFAAEYARLEKDR